MPGDVISGENDLAMRGWDLMNGEFNVVAVPTVAALLGIEDVDLFVVRLKAIRDHFARKRNAEAS